MQKEIVLMIKMTLDTDFEDNEELLDELEHHGRYELLGTDKVKIISSKAAAIAESVQKKRMTL